MISIVVNLDYDFRNSVMTNNTSTFVIPVFWAVHNL